MGVAVDQPGRDPAALAVDDLGARSRQAAGSSVLRAGEDDAAVARDDRAVLDDAEARRVRARASRAGRSARSSRRRLARPAGPLRSLPLGSRIYCNTYPIETQVKRATDGDAMTDRSCRKRACCPQGWALGRPGDDRRTAAIARGRDAASAARAGDERHAIGLPAIGEPAQPRVPARHGGPCGDPRAEAADTFLDLARGDVPFRARR